MQIKQIGNRQSWIHTRCSVHREPTNFQFRAWPRLHFFPYSWQMLPFSVPWVTAERGWAWWAAGKGLVLPCSWRAEPGCLFWCIHHLSVWSHSSIPTYYLFCISMAPTGRIEILVTSCHVLGHYSCQLLFGLGIFSLNKLCPIPMLSNFLDCWFEWVC